MTMDFWVKLLILGFVLLDQGVFVNGQSSTPSTSPDSDQITITTTISPDSGTNHTITDATGLAHSTSLLHASTSLGSESTGTPALTSTKQNQSHSTTHNRTELPTASTSDNLTTISLSTTLAPTSLDDTTYNLTISSTNTSITLKLINNSIPEEACKLKYSFECGSEQKKKDSQTHTFHNLNPNSNYDCIVMVLYNNQTQYNENKSIMTKYGTPGQVINLKCNYTAINSSAYGFSWEIPEITNGPIDGYIISNGLNVECNASMTRYVIHQNVKPFTNYTVKVRAYTTSNDHTISGILKGDDSEITCKTNASKPDKVENAQLILITHNAVRIKCKEPKIINGPKPEAPFILKRNEEILRQSDCNFKVEDLYYLHTYHFELFYDNSFYNGTPTKIECTTKYNINALIGFLVFLIIMTSLALIIVLYKIYKLKKQSSRDLGESTQLIDWDDEKQLLNVEPIPADLLLDTYKRKIADEGRLFLAEFQSIPRVFRKLSIKEARKAQNQNKNRYVDILPYDYTRVSLSVISSEPGSDYINASYIDGFKEPRKYIAAQGPKDETVDDFWKMVWEQKATIIVMVTRCEEGNRTKCAEYWPAVECGTKSFGDVEVKTNDEKICPNYIVRKMHITNCCVGRTGTYIGIDAMLEGLETEGRMDIYGYVVKLRRQRCLMVQVEAQYILIHQALVEYNQFGETELNLSELHEALENMKEKDPPTHPSPLEAEFQAAYLQKLASTKTLQTTKKTKVKTGIQTLFHEIHGMRMIPRPGMVYNFNRVLIKQEEENSKESENESNASSDEESDCEDSYKYINASFITGYWSPKAMIAAQGPLNNTISDFWQMIFQRKVKAIVMLSDLKEGSQESCAKYWGEGKQTYEDIEVDVKDVNTTSSYTTHTFEIRHAKRKETRKVHHYIYQQWNKTELPEEPKELVAMIQNIKTKLPKRNAYEHKHESSVPLLVHCSDGSQQTGTFCALWNLLESAEVEEVIDVFQTVKILRRERPGMVASLENYQFLYDTIASTFPAQIMQAKKSSHQEDAIVVENEIAKQDLLADSTGAANPATKPSKDNHIAEDSNSINSTKESEGSANGPLMPSSTENLLKID